MWEGKEMKVEDWARIDDPIRCEYEQERNERWGTALEQIASVPLPSESPFSLTGLDAECFIHIARRALGLEG